MRLSAAHPIWTLSVDAVLQAMATSREGLSQQEAEARLERLGANVLPQPQSRPLVLRLADQMVHPMALLLWVAGGLALLAGTRQLAIAIWAVVLINGCFSFWQEFQAERTMAALRRALPPRVRVWRDGVLQEGPATTVVPGDCVVLEAGDQIPADGRLIDAQELVLDLALLTGESLPMARHADAISQPQLASRERANLVLAGTTVASGRGTAIVYATGAETEFGHIARLAAQTRRSPSTLQQQVAQIVHTITWIALALGALIVLLSRVLVGLSIQDSLINGIGIIVANVPEGLLPTVNPGAGDQRAAHGSAAGTGAASLGDRDPGIAERHLQRQDRHPHRRADGSAGGVAQRPGRRTTPTAAAMALPLLQRPTCGRAQRPRILARHWRQHRNRPAQGGGSGRHLTGPDPGQPPAPA